jgi:hypothetical protein
MKRHSQCGKAQKENNKSLQGMSKGKHLIKSYLNS